MQISEDRCRLQMIEFRCESEMREEYAMKRYFGMLVGVLVLSIQVPCHAAPKAEPLVGGPCTYDLFAGTCTATSVDSDGTTHFTYTGTVRARISSSKTTRPRRRWPSAARSPVRSSSSPAGPAPPASSRSAPVARRGLLPSTRPRPSTSETAEPTTAPATEQQAEAGCALIISNR